jgi:acyl carrier protein
VNQVFAVYGLSSRLAVSLVGELEDFLATTGRVLELSPTLLWQYPSIATLAVYVETLLQGVSATTNTQNFSNVEQSPIAIIGMGCRFPDANNPTEFWSKLVNGHDAIKQIPASRWNASDFPQINTHRAGLLDAVDLFDAEFFGISDKEADSIDPQQRLILEVSYEALENAGIAPESLAQSETGVFVGISTDDYAAWQFGAIDKIDAYASTGKTFSIAANRLSYILDLRARVFIGISGGGEFDFVTANYDCLVCRQYVVTYGAMQNFCGGCRWLWARRRLRRGGFETFS